ncbi:YfaP family protein [Leptospira sp. WS92.C1]
MKFRMFTLNRIQTPFLILFLSFSAIDSQSLIIESPNGGFTTERIQKISGTISGSTGERVTVVLNGIPQTVSVSGGRFSMNAVVAPGNNLVEVKAGKVSEKVSFFAKVPPRDIKVVLIWDTQTDVDLWVIDPKGEKCYYSHPSTESGGNLDVDVIDGFGPETFTMAKALPGNYSVQVQYYGSYNKPITRVNAYVVLYEGKSNEKRMRFQFVMTRSQQVYHLANFDIEPEN